MNNKYNIDCSKSLHLLKNAFTKRHMGMQCGQLVTGLDEAIAVTLKCAPAPRKRYIRDRDGGRPSEKSIEAIWERALWKHYSHPVTSRSVPGAWYRLVTYQMPLKEKESDQKWGDVDLVGVSFQGLPVVVELKCETATDTPAKMLVQAAAYALALRKSWSYTFASEWRREVRSRYGFGSEAATGITPPTMQLVCAAPKEFWQRWIGPKAATVTPQAWTSLTTLIAAFAERGLPATFVEINHVGYDAAKSPLRLSCRVLDPFLRVRTHERC